ncbi:MAG: molybdopterin molybdotransferase MoeA [Firmicutes bacterium]|nr:molybdopterin molybdotransferase MoeA [Bacillota bacterium]
MVKVDVGIARVLESCKLTEKVARDLLVALGLVAAEDVISPEDLPPFERAAMDGFALRAEDTRGACPESPRTLSVVGEVRAGHYFSGRLNPGEAIAITTGSPVPAGGDAVLMVEDTRRAGSQVQVRREIVPGANIFPVAGDVRSGSRLLSRGQELSPAAVGLLAAVGIQRLLVYRPPQVGIISTGDELVAVDERPGPGQIRNSNSLALAASVIKAGGQPDLYGIFPDDPERIADGVRRALERSDVLLTTGGASFGQYDLMMEVCQRLGANVLFWRVDMQPGKSIVVATWQGKLLFALSGNPAAAMTSFELFVRPALRKMAGHRRLLRPRVKVILTDGYRKPSPRPRYLRGLVYRESGRYYARLGFAQSSDVLSSMVLTNALIIVPAQSGPLAAGQELEALLLDQPEAENEKDRGTEA